MRSRLIHRFWFVTALLCALAALALAATPSGSGPPPPAQGFQNQGNDDDDNPFVGSSGNPSAAPPQTNQNVDDTLPLQVSWALPEVIRPDLFPDETRYFVRRWTSLDVSWISPNSPSSSLPLPPAQTGPVACGCPGPSGQPVNIYGQMEIQHLWTWSATWWDDNEWRAFIPDIWRGRGPCPRFVPNDILHRMPDGAGVIQTADGYRLSPALRGQVDIQNQLDHEVLVALYPDPQTRASLPPVDNAVIYPAPNVDVVQERWASWVQSVMLRRGYFMYDLVRHYSHRWMAVGRPTLWERMRRERYFGSCPLGSWFHYTRRDAHIIRFLLSLGVPVYYRWVDAYSGDLTLADLAPREAPVDATLGFALPPLSPHRRGARTQGTDATHLDFLHRNSQRSGLVAYATQGGEPMHVSDDELIMITGGDINVHRPILRHPALREATGGPSRTPSRSDRTTSRAQGPALLARIRPLSPAANGTTTQPALVRRMLHPPPPVVIDDSSSQTSSSPSLLLRISDAPDTHVAPDLAPAAHGPRSATVPWEFVLNEDETPAALRFSQLLSEGQLPTHDDRLRYAVAHGFAFLAGVERVGPATDASDASQDDDALAIAVTQAVEAHEVPASVVITDNTAPEHRFEQWRAGVRMVLRRPHARAALARGGLIARIAREFGVTIDAALEGPTTETQTLGSPNTVMVPGGRTLTDDYLSESEVAILLGVVGPRARYSLWPTETTFANNWWRDAGEWTEAHEAWFVEHISRLDSPWAAALNKDQWRGVLRSARHHAQNRNE